jgi:putative ATP-dependent endonuclease of OLD family
MHLSRLNIKDFRNFSNFDVKFAGNVVVVGENGVGKSNLLYALRLLLDPTLPDSARQLTFADFWDGLAGPSTNEKITICVEIEDFEDDLDVLAVLTDFRVANAPQTARITYEFRPRAGLEAGPSNDDDYEFVCFGGENESKRFGHEQRRRIVMDLLPALRDAEGDLASWRRSPLRPLIEDAFSQVDYDDLQNISSAIQAATEQITALNAVQELEKRIGDLFAELSGPSQDIEPRLGFSPTDARRLYRSTRLLIDDGARGIADASLGSANLVFLTLKALGLKRMIEENRRDHTFLAIEEPEAHLHPHLQRSVYRQLFASVGGGDEDGELSVILTTHSPQIASVAPLRSIVLLRDADGRGTVGRSTAGIPLSDDEFDDLSRYLDVTRAEMLFARGVLLVEGDAERFLMPDFAEKIEKPLDRLGISVCSVAGTNFQPYAKLLASLEIPFAIVTDWDPREGKSPLGYNRTLKLAKIIEEIRTGTSPSELAKELKAIEDYDKFCDRCEDFGIFSNLHTLEIDLFKGQFGPAMLQTLSEGGLSAERQEWVQAWQADPDLLDTPKFLSLIEDMGKGRFAQRLATKIRELDPPDYIKRAITYVADRV